MDLNDLRVFEKVGALLSFSAAARALGIPKSSVSRSVTRLEAALGTRLCQRTTRTVVLTGPGIALMERCADIMGRVTETLDYVGHLGATPRGLLRITAGIGFGVNVLSVMLPRFLQLYPEVSVTLDLTSKSVELVPEGIDVAIRMGPMAASQLVAVKLGSLSRHLCASPAYLARRSAPVALEDLCHHDTVEMPGSDGRARRWSFRCDGVTKIIEPQPRLCVNDALTIHRMVVHGAGIGVISGYLCEPEFTTGRLLRLFPQWKLDPVEVSIVFPSRRALSPSVRAFVDFMRDACKPGELWLDALIGGDPESLA
ncbi:MAG: LysR family transcriptional regulator [Azospirillaceae bacterium]|nr:LysR family transcriptional regulator [Azospirillaceae bacterium]